MTRVAMGLAAVSVLVALTLFPAGASAHGDLDKQIQELTALIAAELKKQPDAHERAELYFERGELHRLHGDWREAEADYDQAGAHEPGLDAVEMARGKMLLESGQTKRAKVVLERFLAKHVDHPEALLTHAQALVKLGWGIRAVGFLDRALARHPQPEPDHYIGRADLLESLGERYLARAVDGLDQGIRRLGPVVSLDSRAIELDVRLKRTDRALRRAERQAAMTIRKDIWLARRAAILDAGGREREARQARAEALSRLTALPPHLQARGTTVALRQQLEKELD